MPSPSTLKINDEMGNNKSISPLTTACYVLGFTILFTAMSAFVKISANAGIPIITIMFFRYLFGLLPVSTLLLSQKTLKQELFHPEWRSLLIRTIMGMIGMWCVFTSFKMLPLAEATVLHFSSAFFLTVLSIYFLNEHVGKWRWGAIIAGFIGVVIVLNPSFNANIYGQVIAVCAAMIMALNMVMVRSLHGRASPEAMTIYMHVVGTVMLLPFAINAGFIPTIEQWPALAITGLCAGVGHMFLNRAYMKAPGALVSSFAYVQIIFVTAVGFFVFGDIPNEHFILGSSIIIGSGIVIGIREYLHNKNNLVKDMA